MKCEICNSPLTGKQQRFCSDKCRMQANRQQRAFEDATGLTKSKQPEPEQPEPEHPYQLKHEQTVYNRPAVSYDQDKFETRPEPLDSTDTPHAGGRGRYTRQDGTVYQFDCRGHSFECRHPFQDKYGKTRLAIYKDSDEVRACYEPEPIAVETE